MQNSRLDEAQAEINNLRYADDTTLMEENKKELKSNSLEILLVYSEEWGKMIKHVSFDSL